MPSQRLIFVLLLSHIILRTLSTWTSPMYGNCFVFNSFNLNSSKSVALPGPGYGLTLVLNLEQEHYGGITPSAGARCLKQRSLDLFLSDHCLPWSLTHCTMICLTLITSIERGHYRLIKALPLIYSASKYFR